MAGGLPGLVHGYAPWIPEWPVAALLLVLVVTAVVIAHRCVVRWSLRQIGPERAFLYTLVRQSRGPIRLALAIFVTSLMLPTLPFNETVLAALAQILLVAFVILIGWTAATALHLAADRYLMRYRLDTADNLLARKHVTQVRILRQVGDILIALLTISAALMTLPPVRQYGVSLFASAGVAGLVAGLAARPVLANLFAGIQIALTQPIRVDDAVVVEGEWGWIEDITSTYVVIKLWDWRRLVVPLTYFIEKPFQNWTKEAADIIGSVFIYVDYRAPVPAIREKLVEIARASPLWDGKVVNLQVSDAKTGTIELRALVSARTSPQVWDLRCEVREKLIAFLQENYPGVLPRVRAELVADEGQMAMSPSAKSSKLMERAPPATR